MNDTITTLKDFWKYFTEKKGYKVIVRTIPFALVVGLILTIMTVYAVIRFSSVFDLGSIPNMEYMTEEQIYTYISGLSTSVVSSIAVYIGLITLVLLILALGIQNSIYNSTKNHVISDELPTIKNTFSNATKGYGRFVGYMFIYLFLPLLAITIVLMLTNLYRYTFIVTIISTLLSFFFYSKMLRIENGDYLVPVVVSLISILLSFILSYSSGIIFGIIYLIVVIFGTVSSMILIYSLLKDNDFHEGIKYE